METVNQLKQQLLDRVCLSSKDDPFPLFKAKPRGYIKNKAKYHKCPYSKDLLEDLYISRKMTRRQVAQELNVPKRTIDNWLTIMDIRLSSEQYSGRLGGQDRSIVLNAKRNLTRRQQQVASRNTHLQYGYVLLYNPAHPYCNNYGYTQEHRYVIESHLHRFLKPDEVVHHIDKNRSNNSIDNLALFQSDSQHTKLHRAIEEWGFYMCGFSERPNDLVIFEEKVLWGGVWVESLNLSSLIKEKINKEKDYIETC